MLCHNSFATIMVLAVAHSMYFKRLLNMNPEGVLQACTLYQGQKMVWKLHFLLVSYLVQEIGNCQKYFDLYAMTEMGCIFRVFEQEL